MVKRTAVMVFIGLMSFGTAGFADEGKDESGKGKQRDEERKDDHGKGESYRGEPRYEGRDRRGGGNSYFHQHGYTRIPNGHLPPPGECRIWYPDRPAGHQPPPFKCGQARGPVEPGGWLISPGTQPQEVEVAVYDARRPGIVIDVGIFDASTGSMIRVVGGK